MAKKTFIYFILLLNSALISCESKLGKKNIEPSYFTSDSTYLNDESKSSKIETTERITEKPNLYGSWKIYELKPENVDAPKEWILNFYEDNSYNFKFENKYYSPRISCSVSGNSIVVSNSYATREIGEIKNISKDSLEIYFFDLQSTGKFVRLSHIADEY